MSCLGDCEHHFQVFDGHYIPNSWVMFDWDIYQLVLNHQKWANQTVHGICGGFLKCGNPQIIHFLMGFSIINHPFWYLHFRKPLYFGKFFDSKNINERGPELGDTQFLWMKTVMIFCKGWNGVRNFWAKWIRIDSS